MNATIAPDPMVQERCREPKADLVQILCCVAGWGLSSIAACDGERDTGILQRIRIIYPQKLLRRGVDAINSI